MAKSTLNPEEP